MHRQRLAREGTRDPLPVVEEDVDREVDAGRGGDRPNGVVDRVPSMTPQVALGSPIRRALCSASMVSSPARPGATIFGPPLNPAKKCGSTNPVVIRRSAASHSRARNSGTSPT